MFYFGSLFSTMEFSCFVLVHCMFKMFSFLLLVIFFQLLLQAVVSFVTMQLQLCSVFFTFSLGTKTHYFGRTILHGGARVCSAPHISSLIFSPCGRMPYNFNLCVYSTKQREGDLWSGISNFQRITGCIRAVILSRGVALSLLPSCPPSLQ